MKFKILMMAALLFQTAQVDAQSSSSSSSSSSSISFTSLTESMNELAENLRGLYEPDQDKRLWGDYSTETFEYEFASKPGIRIRIDHRFGDIEVIKGTGSKILLTGEKRVSARSKEEEMEFLKGMRVNIEERAGGIEIETEYPEERDRQTRFRKKVNNFGIMMTLQVPHDCILIIENSFGDIDLTDLKGSFDIRNSFGSLNADRLAGEIDLNNQFGEIIATDLKSANSDRISIHNEHGEMEVRNLEGTVTLENQFGEIRADDLKGNAVIDGAHAQILVKRVTGDVEVSNAFAKITVRDITGTLDVENSNGRVEAYNISKDTEIRSSFAQVRAVEIGGTLRISNQNSSVVAEDIKGDLDIDNTFGSVDIINANGNIFIVNRNANISVEKVLSDLNADAKRIKLETSFAGIEITLPRDISAVIEAASTFGNIRSDFEMDTENVSMNSKRMTARLKDGKHEINLDASNGSVTIRRK